MSDKKEYYKNKLQAFFHDPIDKPFQIQGHEDRAAEQIISLGLEEKEEKEKKEKKEIKQADQIASAADRVLGIKANELKVDFNKEAEITHPLGGRLKISEETNFLNVDRPYEEQVLKDYLKGLKEKYKEDYEKIFYHLWRIYPSDIQEEKYNERKIGKLWNFLPADTRIPDHFIVDHNFLTSAIYTCGQNISFCKFSLGPIQSFISTAKRTEDFWIGSYILSYLSAFACISVIKELGADHIIFPNVKYNPIIDQEYFKKELDFDINYTSDINDDTKISPEKLISSLSNVILFICPSDKAEEIIKNMIDNVKSKWKQIANSIKEQINDSLSEYSQQIFDNQIENFLEFYYSIVKLGRNQLNEFIEFYQEKISKINKLKKVNNKYNFEYSSYNINIGNFWGEIYDYLDKNFVSNKLIRKFNYIEEKGRKCILCGERSALAESEEKSNKNSDLKKYWQKISSELDDFRLDKQGNDRLCSICLIKRLAGKYYFQDLLEKDISFPSLATIATWKYKIKIIEKWNDLSILNGKIQNIYNLIKQSTKNKASLFNYIPNKIWRILKEKGLENNEQLKNILRLDGQYFYKEFYDKTEEDNQLNLNKKEIKAIKDTLKEINKVLSIESPNKYYAIIRLDGDEMGKWLSGTHNKYPKFEEIAHTQALENQHNLENPEILSEKRKVSPSVHSFISKALNIFSLKIVRSIVEEEYCGKLIYAGGDDVLALVPMDDALECAEKIRFAFSGNIDRENNIDISNDRGYYVKNNEIIPTMGNKASMSAGIVYCHYKYNFQSAIEESRKLEKRAKEELRRDAYAISVIKHSGNKVDFGLKWLTLDEEKKERTCKIIHKILDLFFKEKISMNFFSSCYDALSNIIDEEIIFSLLKKEARDHCILKKEKQQISSKLIENIKKIFDSGLIEEQKNINNLLALFKVLRFFASKGRD